MKWNSNVTYVRRYVRLARISLALELIVAHFSPHEIVRLGRRRLRRCFFLRTTVKLPPVDLSLYIPVICTQVDPPKYNGKCFMEAILKLKVCTVLVTILLCLSSLAMKSLFWNFEVFLQHLMYAFTGPPSEY